MKAKSGYTLVELIIIIFIMGILASIVSPRMYIALQKAYQATAKGNLGSMRSCLNLYYSANEGMHAFTHLDGFIDDDGESLTNVLVPAYIQKIPVPKLLTRVNGYNGFEEGEFDVMAKIYITETNPPKDVFIQRGEPDPVTIMRPYLFDPESGALVYCNDNLDTVGNLIYRW
jgi:prepilin-type N-terminal cleavage/methylation domain-containing protein